jgi:hypothetical protein
MQGKYIFKIGLAVLLTTISVIDVLSQSPTYKTKYEAPKGIEINSRRENLPARQYLWRSVLRIWGAI